MVTVAPGRTAPLESVTRPRISAVVTCAWTAVANKRHIAPRTTRLANVMEVVSFCNRLQMLTDRPGRCKIGRARRQDVTGCISCIIRRDHGPVPARAPEQRLLGLGRRLRLDLGVPDDPDDAHGWARHRRRRGGD